MLLILTTKRRFVNRTAGTMSIHHLAELFQLLANRMFVDGMSLCNLAGTINFMSPEVIEEEKFYFESDVWSAACFLLNMLTGFSPWTKSFPGLGTYLFVIPQRQVAKQVILSFFLKKCAYHQ